MPLDQKIVQETQKELESRSGSNFFVRLSKKEPELEVRILDPSPAMNGNWFIEVPAYWVNDKHMIDPKFVDPKDTTIADIIADIKAEFTKGDTPEKQDGLKEFNALMNRPGKFPGQTLIREEMEFWAPVLVLDLDIQNDQVVGIYDDNGQIDASKVMNYIRDKNSKILQARRTQITAINKVVTSRGGYECVLQDKGFNIILTRAEGKTVTFGAVKSEPAPMPMPMDFYGTGEKAMDPVKVAKSMIYTKDYLRLIWESYFFGDVQVPKEAEYQYPELRTEKKEESGEQQSSRRRSGATEEATTSSRRGETTEDTTANEPQTSARRGAPSEPQTSSRRGAAPQGRNLLEDVENE